MKRNRITYSIVFLVMAVLLSVAMLPLSAQEDELQPGTAIVLIRMWLFAEADTGSDRLVAVAFYEMVTIIEIEGDWAHVEYGDVEGWGRITSNSLVNVDSPPPLPRGYHRMTYDIESDRVLLFGGATNPFRGPYFADTWTYEVDTNTWTKMEPEVSPPVGEGPFAYDAQSDRAIMFVGAELEMPLAPLSETWAYDTNTDTWTNMEPAVAPPGLLGARMAYDAESDRMILFSGMDSMAYMTDGIFVYINETWAFDFDSNTWTQMAPTTSPPPGNYFAMAYDAGADRVIVTGVLGTEFSDDTWVYDFNTDTWEMRETAESPGSRSLPAMVYAADTGQMILFGGGPELSDYSVTVQDDTWSYDFDSNTWTELHPETFPSARGWHAMAYSTAADRVILFGGGTDRKHSTMETWLYDPGANTWTQMGP
jgi:N-acetylneuraminic acid mutarotase